ncbi:hypothetical protein [Streptomyces sp. NBC_00120]|nr:hypothetical protein [Streptomyces sp. NBC_00120]MCX5323640.1 hypothetical protein [Streptomyces sp. NBC_00120]
MSDFDELLKATEAYTMAGIADCITCPTLVLKPRTTSSSPGSHSASWMS